MLSDEVIAYSKAFGEMRVERDEWKKKYESIYRQANHIARGNDISEIVEPVRHEWGNGIAVLDKEEIRKIANTEAHKAMSDVYGKFVCPECGTETEEEWHDAEIFSNMKYCTACMDKFEIGMRFIRKAPPE